MEYTVITFKIILILARNECIERERGREKMKHRNTHTHMQSLKQMPNVSMNDFINSRCGFKLNVYKLNVYSGIERCLSDSIGIVYASDWLSRGERTYVYVCTGQVFKKEKRSQVQRYFTTHTQTFMVTIELMQRVLSNPYIHSCNFIEEKKHSLHE